MPRLSVAIPCYNEEAVLPETYRRVVAACEALLGDDFELVLVNDGSSDRSWAIIEGLSRDDRRVVGIDLSRNHGHQLALSAGLSLCRGERILIIDADLQDPPELLGGMWDLMDQGADVVYGQRAARLGETWFKRVSAQAFYRLFNRMTDMAIPTDTGDFRLISRRVLDVFNAMPERYRFIRGMISWVGFRQVPLPYIREERYAGVTHYPLRNMLNFALDALTSFSAHPLRLAIRLAFWQGGLSLLLLVYALASWLFLDAVHGWTSLIVVILLVSSVHTLMLGIIGEYVGRLYMESKGRPLFVIRQVLRAAE